MSKGNSEPILAFSVPKASVCALGTPEPIFKYKIRSTELPDKMSCDEMVESVGSTLPVCASFSAMSFRA